jgi:hypothetical protein
MLPLVKKSKELLNGNIYQHWDSLTVLCITISMKEQTIAWWMISVYRSFLTGVVELSKNMYLPWLELYQCQLLSTQLSQELLLIELMLLSIVWKKSFIKVQMCITDWSSNQQGSIWIDYLHFINFIYHFEFTNVYKLSLSSLKL